ncbi:MAG: DUF1211 domain-containing protein [Chloroflexi bacterium]|nr:DUF1211 domain-containing protein [Chloroflexota bacterium]
MTMNDENQTAQPPAETSENEDRLGLERIAAFSDGVFAIAITLLILDIRLPASDTVRSDGELLQDLTSIWPDYRAYIISFLVIGSFWIAHHRKFRKMRRYDDRLMVLNMLFLMVIAFIPFPTIVISEEGNLTSTIFYSLTIILAGLLSLAMTWYSTGSSRLMEIQHPHTRRHEILRGFVVPAIFLLSIAIAVVDHEIAKISWLLVVPALLLIR